MGNVRIQSVVSNSGRRIFGRLLPGTELIPGIKVMCSQADLSCGGIVSMIGSLAEARLVYPVPDEVGKIGIRYCDPVHIKGPLELLSCQGIIGQDQDQKMNIHLHGLVGTPEMKVIGGHFLEGGNPVLATAEVVIQESSDLRLLREVDEETGFPLFKFYPETST